MSNWLPVLLLLLLSHPAHLLAQEALISTLNLDKALPRETTALPLPNSDTPHIGPVRFNLSVDARNEYNDNINYSDHHPLSDVIIGGGFHADIFWPISQGAQLSLNGGVSYLAYLQNPKYGRFDTGPASVLAYNIGFPDGSISLFNQFSYSQEVANEPSLTGFAQYPRFDENLGFRVSWWPGKWIFQGGYSHDIFWTDSSTFSYLDRASEYFFVRAARRIAENSEFGVEGSLSLTDYDQPIQNNNQSWSVGPYFDWKITQSLHASARGGFTGYHFDASQNPASPSPATDLSSYYYGLTLDHQLTQYLGQHLSVDRAIRLGINQGTDVFEETVGWYYLNYRLTDYITLNLGFGYTHGTQSLESIYYIFPGFGIPVFSNEKYDQFIGAPGISWHFTEKLTAWLDYRYTYRMSNLADRDYRINFISLRLSYSF